MLFPLLLSTIQVLTIQFATGSNSKELLESREREQLIDLKFSNAAGDSNNQLSSCVSSERMRACKRLSASKRGR